MPHCGDCPALTARLRWWRRLPRVQWRCPLTDKPVRLGQECDAPAEHLRRLVAHCTLVLSEITKDQSREP
jgi:hypothetical protein